MTFNLKYVLLFIGSILLLYLLYFECFIKADKDFDIFIGASRLISEGESCYNIWIPAGEGALLYYYSPLFALILTPLAFLPQYLYNIIWFLFNLYFLYRIIRSVDYYLNISEFSSINRNIFILIIVLCTLRFLLYNFDLGQMTIFLVFASMESIRLILNNKIWLGAALLALAINIKLLPITLLVYLIYRGEYKASLLVILFFTVYLFLPGIFIGMDFNHDLIIEWWRLMTNTVNKSIVDDIGRSSLSSFIPSLLMETKGEVALRRNLLSLDAETTQTVLNVVRGFLILFTLFFLRSFHFRKITLPPLHHFYSLSYILLITPLIAPHQGKYSLFYMLPAYCFVIYMTFRLYLDKKKTVDYRISNKAKLAITGIIVSFLLTTITTDGIIGQHYSTIANHYYLITIGAMILIIPMVIFKPKKINIEGLNDKL